jgi:hypothetical protein
MSKRGKTETDSEADRILAFAKSNQGGGQLPDPPASAPPPPPVQPAPQSEQPDWLTRALDPEAAREIVRLAGLNNDPRARSRVDPAAFELEQKREREQRPKARNVADWDGKPKTSPQPMHAQGRTQSRYVFPGITSHVDVAADKLGFPLAGDWGPIRSKLKKFSLVAEAGSFLASASTAPNIDAAKDSLGRVQMYRNAIQAAVDAIDAATAEVEQALGLTD